MKNIKAIIFTAVILVTFVFFALGSGSSSDNTVENGSGDNKSTTEQSSELTVKVGDVLNTDTLKITYVSCEEFKDYNEYLGPKEGNIIYKLSFSVENTGSTDRFISNLDFNCYADNAAADPYYSGDGLSATISAGRSASGSVYFEVPKSSEKIEVEYETNFWANKKAIFVVK